MDIIGIINFILIAGVIQGFVFNIFTVHITKRKVGWAVIYLNLTVLLISLNNLQAWLTQSEFSTNNFFLEELVVPWYMGIMPVFHAFLIYYLRVRNTIETYIKPAIWIFTIEIVIRILLIGFVYYFVPNKDNSLITTYTSIEEILNASFNLYIFYECYKLIFKKQELYAFILKYDDISWLRVILRLGSFVFLLWILAIVIFNITGDKLAYYPLRLGTSILLYWMGYQGFYRYNFVNERISLRRSISSNKALLVDNEKIEINSPQRNESNSNQKVDFEKVDAYIIKKQRYLDPKLGLEDLANEMEMSPPHLSRLINSYSNKNFSDYINSLRIQQAKKLLNDDEFDQYTIVSIGLECGFNSKSTFYTAFKKFTSKTPSEFRKTTS